MKTFLTLLTFFLTVGYFAQSTEEATPEVECPVAENIECIDMPPMFITAAITSHPTK